MVVAGLEREPLLFEIEIRKRKDHFSLRYHPEKNRFVDGGTGNCTFFEIGGKRPDVAGVHGQDYFFNLDVLCFELSMQTSLIIHRDNSGNDRNYRENAVRS